MVSKDCPSYSLSSGASKYDYVLRTSFNTKEDTGQSFSIYDAEGRLIRSTGSRTSSAVKQICNALDSATLIEIVDMNNLTQTSDLRNAPSSSVITAVTHAVDGRHTHTDNASLNVIAKGEHALLDCYEHSKGCTTMSPGKYYAEIDGDSLWIDYEMPITHTPRRNHYVIAGGW